MKIDQSLIVVILIVVVIIIITSKNQMSITGEGLTNNEIGSIITAIDTTAKNKGNVLTFYKTIGNSNFSPLKYAQLMTLYKRGDLTIPRARVLLDV